MVNLLNFAEGEKVAECLAVRDFTLPDHYLMMATRAGLVKKTTLAQYGRPMKGGIIAIKLKEDDELVDVAVTRAGDEVVLSTARGMAIRFSESDARPMGRKHQRRKRHQPHQRRPTGGHGRGRSGAATLLTVCAKGYGKRTPFGPNSPVTEGPILEGAASDSGEPIEDGIEPEAAAAPEPAEASEVEEEASSSSSNRYRTQRRGGKGVRDIKTTERNGPVVSIVDVLDSDEVLVMTSRGKLQRLRAGEISVIGRNTQGVRIMSLDEADTVAAVVRVPRDAMEIRQADAVDEGAAES